MAPMTAFNSSLAPPVMRHLYVSRPMNDGPVNPVGSPLDPLAGIELLDQEDLIRWFDP